MLKRTITAFCAVLILIPILIFSDTWLFPCAVAVVSVICLFEMFKCIGLHKNIALCLPVYICAVGIPFLQRMIDDVSYTVIIAFMIAIAYLVYTFALVIWSHGKLSYRDACISLLTSFYIVTALNMVIYIRDFSENGRFIYLLIFIGAWITDIFAYFTGVLFGKHKLIADVSPKKTVEGSIGGTVFCSIAFVALGLVVDVAFEAKTNLIFLAIGGIIMAIISQIGDLIMSVIKRNYGIKDYGKLFPGHGGMLDRLDSVLAVSLAVALMCMFSYVTGIKMM